MKKRGSSKIFMMIALGAGILLIFCGLALGAANMGKTDWGDPTKNTLGKAGSINCQSWSDAFSSDYQTIITNSANEFGIHPAMLAAIFLSEHSDHWPSVPISGPWADSPKKAQGPFQFMPATWSGDIKSGGFKYTDNDAQDFTKASRVAAFHLKGIFDTYGWSAKSPEDNQIKCVAAGYNGGGGMCKDWKDRNFGDPQPATDNDYHTRTLANFKNLNQGCSASNNTGTLAQDKPDTSWRQTKRQDSVWLKAVNYCGARVTGDMNPQGVVVHYTAGDSVDGAVSAMTQGGRYVHLIIDKNGDIYQLLPLNKMVASGSGDARTWAIGIELVGANEDQILKQPAQKKALINAINYLIKTYSMMTVVGNATNFAATHGIYGHMQVQGKMKPDPSTTIQSQMLAEANKKDGSLEKDSNYDTYCGVLTHATGCSGPGGKQDPGAKYLRDVVWNNTDPDLGGLKINYDKSANNAICPNLAK